MNGALAKETGIASYIARRLMWRLKKLNPWSGWEFRLPSGGGIRLFPGSFFSADIYCTRGFVDWGAEQLLLEYLKDFDHKGVGYDVGANMGYYSMLIASTGRRVFAFEPDARNHPMLLAQRNGRVTLVPKAVGRSEGVVRLSLGCESSVSHLALEGCEAGAGTDIECETLDGFRSRRPAAERVDVVKMDIEGFEIEALEGAGHLVRQDQPVFLIEFNVEPGRPNSFERLARFVAAHRYRVFAMIRCERGRKFHTVLQEVDAAKLEGLWFKMLFLVPDQNPWFARKAEAGFCFETMRLAMKRGVG